MRNSSGTGWRPKQWQAGCTFSRICEPNTCVCAASCHVPVLGWQLQVRVEASAAVLSARGQDWEQLSNVPGSMPAWHIQSMQGAGHTSTICHTLTRTRLHALKPTWCISCTQTWGDDFRVYPTPSTPALGSCSTAERGGAGGDCCPPEVALPWPHVMTDLLPSPLHLFSHFSRDVHAVHISDGRMSTPQARGGWFTLQLPLP